ncbi:MAG: M23 family metallopeptidase [Clostridia bacterium]|nr:M23 family metallopeptidase [Clostridia bacterium]
MNIDIDLHEEEKKINWIDVLSFLAAKYGGNIKEQYNPGDMDTLVKKIKEGETPEDMAHNKKLYSYFHEVYSAVLGEFLGEYSIQTGFDENNEPIMEQKYGLKVFSPIAKGFPYQHYDDFGNRRTYGYSRPHLGHDMMAATGTPVIAVESGIVEVMGWNQYGGWRIGIRSFDKKRYYYYAHLRKDKPFHKDLVEGKIVKAGDVIGYVGRTGYSVDENVNNIKTSHLHIGVELIFDESQKECDNEIWIDMYAIAKLLAKNQSEVVRSPEDKHFCRKYDFTEGNLNQ